MKKTLFIILLSLNINAYDNKIDLIVMPNGLDILPIIVIPPLNLDKLLIRCDKECQLLKKSVEMLNRPVDMNSTVLERKQKDRK